MCLEKYLTTMIIHTYKRSLEFYRAACFNNTMVINVFANFVLSIRGLARNNFVNLFLSGIATQKYQKPGKRKIECRA